MKSRAIIMLVAQAMVACGLYGQAGTNCCNNMAISGQTTTCTNQVDVGANGSNQGGSYCQASTQATNFTCTSTDPNNGTNGKSCGNVPTMSLSGTGGYGWDSSGNFHACDATYASPNNPSNAPTNYASSSGTQSSYTNAVTSYSGYSTANGTCTPSGTPRPSTATCPIIACASPPPPPPPDPCCNHKCFMKGNKEFNGATLQKTQLCCTCDCPIIIDTSGNGFDLTSAVGGVQFDMSGRQSPEQMAWTASDSGNAFLCLPDAKGRCDDGKYLFGNFTPQPATQRPNGYLALAVYDLPVNGGNGDGLIDSRDAVYSRLRLWIDRNHDGISQPDEIYTLPSLGVYSISLNYKEDRRTDQYGNLFRFRSQVNVGGPAGSVARTIYDVFLLLGSNSLTAQRACPAAQPPRLLPEGRLH